MTDHLVRGLTAQDLGRLTHLSQQARVRAGHGPSLPPYADAIRLAMDALERELAGPELRPPAERELTPGRPLSPVDDFTVLLTGHLELNGTPIDTRAIYEATLAALTDGGYDIVHTPTPTPTSTMIDIQHFLEIVDRNVAAERDRAHRKHGDTSMRHQPALAERRNRILVEEVGEISMAWNNHDHGHFDRRRLAEKIYGELIQVAAMATDWAAAIARELDNPGAEL